MDSLHSPISDQDQPDAEPGQTGGQPRAHSVAGADERRMQVRAYNFWASLLNERRFPDANALDPATLTDFGPHSVLLDFTVDMAQPAVTYVGSELAQECDASGPIRDLRDVPSGSLLTRITDHYLQTIDNQAPIGFEAQFVNQRGVTILYRGILLPFSRDDHAIDFIYGVINWKQQTEQDAIRAARAPSEETPTVRRSAPSEPLTAWADGPVDVSARRSDDHESLFAQLRTIEVRPLSDVDSEGSEFTLLVARRLTDGNVVLLGELADDDLLQRAAHRLAG